ncbi:MAG: hypothetical protein PHI85_05870 [Victivallaceae bacterium]|nr:hypothetical protein [Victivallaceae bacterium]
MLTYLKITNLALMAHAEVEFGPGFNAVTGETGAGKSVLLGTVALLLGVRADKSLIRQGCDRCEIVGAISLDGVSSPAVAALFDDLAIRFDPSEELRLRRVITHTGSRCFVNDTPVGLQALAGIGGVLMDVYSANEQYSLLDHARQLEMIDRFGGCSALLSAYEAEFAALKKLRAAREEAMKALPSPQEAELLGALVADIDAVNPEDDEDRAVGEKFTLAANRREIIELASGLSSLLSEGENSICDQLAAVYRQLSTLDRLVSGRLGERLDRCSILEDGVRELSDSVREVAESTDLDDEALAGLEVRMSALQQLKRRHGPQLADVIEKWRNAKARLAGFAAAGQMRKKFDDDEKKIMERLLAAGSALTVERRKQAAAFAVAVGGVLTRLGMPYARIVPDFTAVAPRENGLDEVELLFSANRGIEPRALRLTASSGELSRVMLAVKAVLAERDTVPVLIFDEIDANVGGETANEVAAVISELSRRRQVLCISHLAQVAARADRHFSVRKSDGGADDPDAVTSSEIVELSGDARTAELARMLGGGPAALRHAGELLR